MLVGMCGYTKQLVFATNGVKGETPAMLVRGKVLHL